MSTTSDRLQALMVAALAGTTAAIDNVFTPRDWPTTPIETPILLVQSPSEHKESLGRSGAQQFTTTVTIRVVGRLTGKAQTGDAGAMAVLAALGVFQGQIERAVINSYDLTQAIQQIAAVDVKNGVSSDSELHLGELVMDFHLETYEGPELFAPIDSSPIDEMAIYADLVNVYSPTGVFVDLEPFDAATPAPRTEGPDGRPEATILIDFTAPPIESVADLDFGANLIANTIV